MVLSRDKFHKNNFIVIILVRVIHYSLLFYTFIMKVRKREFQSGFFVID